MYGILANMYGILANMYGMQAPQNAVLIFSINKSVFAPKFLFPLPQIFSCKAPMVTIVIILQPQKFSLDHIKSNHVAVYHQPLFILI